MICPYCDTINHDEVETCRNCGIRLNSSKVRPEDVQREKKYLRVGIAAAAFIIFFLVFVITLSSCICSGCVKENAGENVINEEVDGSYFDDTASDTDLVSGADTSGSDVSSADAPADVPAETE